MTISDSRTRKGLRPALVRLGILIGFWAGVPAMAQEPSLGPLGNLGAEPEPAFALRDSLDWRWSLPLRDLQVNGNARADSVLIVRSSGLEIGHPVSPPGLAHAVR